MAKVLILAGDAAEDLETMFIKYRLAEADYEPYVAAPTMRPIKLVVHDFEPDWDTYVERPGRTCPVDVTFAEVDPSEYAALVIPGGRAPEFIRVDPDVARIVEHFFARRSLSARSATARRSLPRSGSCAAGAAPPSARSRPTSRWRAASSSTARRWSTGTWSRAAAGATWPSGRARSSSCSTARRLPHRSPLYSRLSDSAAARASSGGRGVDLDHEPLGVGAEVAGNGG